MRRTWSTRSLLAVLAALVFVAYGCGDDPGAGDPGSGGASSGGVGGDLGNIGEDTGDSDTVSSSGGSSSGADAGGTEDSGSSGGTSSSGGDGGASSGADAGADTEECVGEPGCPCKENAECDTGYCLDFPDGKQCAKLCTETCPNGQACKDISGGKGDKVFACVSNLIALCAPCNDDQLCQHNGVAGLCLDYGADGKFCGGPCDKDSDCPQHYECIEATGVKGTKAKQCKRKDTAPKPANGNGAICGCSEWAVNKGAKTQCTKTNGVGTCKADRACTAKGLETCTATDAKPEVCNTLDDDCNGKVDDLDAEFKCSKKLFATLGSMATCTTDDDCVGKSKSGKLEKCDMSGVVGACKELEGECFGIPSCTAGGKLICNEAKTPIAEACDLQDNDCDGKTDEAFTWKSHDGKDLGMGQPCGTGECGGGNVVCETLKTAVCDTAKKSSKEKCDALDNDCDGDIDDKGEVCVDGNECTFDTCDGASKSCSNPASVDCDDNNPCTTDSCDTKLGKCVNKPQDGASCDDGDACTVGDKCGTTKDNVAVCLAGASTKVCDDANLCTDDSCDPKKGCVQLSNAATQACYTGDPKTKGTGECKGGTKLCKEGALQGACVGEFTPNNTEICDAKDDDCNGVVDNGCAANIVTVRTSSIAGSIKGGKHSMNVRGGGESTVHGVAAGKKKTALLGWYAWVASLIK